MRNEILRVGGREEKVCVWGGEEIIIKKRRKKEKRERKGEEGETLYLGETYK